MCQDHTVVASWSIIQPSERSCSGRSGYFLFHPAGFVPFWYLASPRLDLR